MRKLLSFIALATIALAVFAQPYESPTYSVLGKNSTMKCRFGFDDSRLITFIRLIKGSNEIAKAGDEVVFVTKDEQNVSYKLTEEDIANRTQDGFHPFVTNPSQLFMLSKGISSIYLIHDGETETFNVSYAKTKIRNAAKSALNAGIATGKVKLEIEEKHQTEEEKVFDTEPLLAEHHDDKAAGHLKEDLEKKREIESHEKKHNSKNLKVKKDTEDIDKTISKEQKGTITEKQESGSVEKGKHKKEKYIEIPVEDVDSEHLNLKKVTLGWIPETSNLGPFPSWRNSLKEQRRYIKEGKNKQDYPSWRDSHREKRKLAKGEKRKIGRYPSWRDIMEYQIGKVKYRIVR